jgi:hypothetical protein
MGEGAVLDTVLPRPSEHEEVTRLAPLLSESQARSIWNKAHLENLTDDEAVSLAALAGRLPEPERPAAVDGVLAAYTPTALGQVQARILGLLGRAASTERITQALREFLSRRPHTVKYELLRELGPGLPAALNEEALRYALTDDDDLCCRSLAALAPRLSGDLLDRAIAHVSDMKHQALQGAALTALARRLPHDREDRETVLAAALQAALSAPLQSRLEGVMPALIPELPERMRPHAVNAAIDWACSELRNQSGQNRAGGQQSGMLDAVLKVLRGPELERLYTRLGNEVQVPHLRASAQAAVIRQAGASHAASFFTDGPPLHRDWPSDAGRARLMDLIAASAWWIHQHDGDADVDDVIQDIFDVTHWWP